MNKKFIPLKRIRKQSPSPDKNLRLHRSEFGDSLKKNYNPDHYYPDSIKLLNSLAKFYRVKEENICIGLGAEGIIKDIYLTEYLKKKKLKILTTAPNFFMYNYYAKLFNFNFNQVEIIDKNKNFIDLKKLINEIKKKKINFLILVNPSSPIEKFWTNQEISKILKYCKKYKILVLLDQVYNKTIQANFLKLFKQFNNLIILNSLSKIFGLPGLRVGFCFSNIHTIEEINSSRLAIELSSNSIKLANKNIKNNKDIFNKKVLQIENARKYALRQFEKLKIETINKNINSLTFFCKDSHKRDGIVNFLREKKIYVNPVNTKYHYNLINVTTTNIKNLKIFFYYLKKIN